MSSAIQIATQGRSAKRCPQALRRTAYHEAGHAVVAVHFGLALQEVSIVPSKRFESLGHILHPNVYGYEYEGKRERRKLVTEMIQTSYAGFYAERLFDPAANFEQAQGDWDNAWRLPARFDVMPRGCGYLGDEVYCRFLERCEKKAERLVARLWPAIVELAEVLIERKSLTGEEAGDIVGFE